MEGSSCASFSRGETRKRWGWNAQLAPPEGTGCGQLPGFPPMGQAGQGPVVLIPHCATLVGAEAVCSPSAGDLPARPDPLHVPTGTARRFLRAGGEGDRTEMSGACGGQ